MFLSRDVTMAGELVHALAPVLVRAVRTDDYGTAPFERVAAFQAELGAFNDRLLAGARTACADFRLVNAYARVWLLWQILADLSLKRARLDCAADAGESADPTGDWSAVERFEWGGIWFRVPRGLREVLDQTFALLEDVRAGVRTPADAADRIFAELRRSEAVPPLYAFGDPDARVYRFTMAKRLQMLWWTKTSAPADFRRLLTRDYVTSVTSDSSR
jgi:FADH2 O2-dependent halogenase